MLRKLRVQGRQTTREVSVQIFQSDNKQDRLLEALETRIQVPAPPKTPLLGPALWVTVVSQPTGPQRV